MSRKYEAVYILDSSLEEAAITEKLEKLHALLAHDGAEPVAYDHWGKRTLAYPIASKETGYYVVAKFDTAAEKLPEFERALKLDEQLLRHLIVLDDGATMSVPPSAKDEEDND
jgi:small subunit ribosomal protein S6